MSTVLRFIKWLRSTTTFAVALLLTGCASLPPHQIDQIGAVEIAWVKSTSTTPVDPTAATVVFQSGLGDGMSTWASVINGRPQSTSYFAYDRPGYGSSGPVSDQSRDPCHIASELRELLKTAGISPPYLLVGHSLGGQYQYAFARLFPADVAGMVLLDPAHPDHWIEMQQQAPTVAAALSGFERVAFEEPMTPICVMPSAMPGITNTNHDTSAAAAGEAGNNTLLSRAMTDVANIGLLSICILPVRPVSRIA